MEIHEATIGSHIGWAISGKFCKISEFQSIKATFINKKIYSSHVFIDLRQLFFISSNGVGVLCEINGIVNRTEKKLVLIEPQPEVLEVLETCGVTDFITIMSEETLESIPAE